VAIILNMRMNRTHRRRASRGLALSLVVLMSAALTACGSTAEPAESAGEKPVIVVTHALIAAAVVDLVGDKASVQVLIPNGSDPHEWSPSAKDIERLMAADLVVRNGLGLEAQLGSALGRAADDGIPVFTVSDHVKVRTSSEDPLDEHQADDQHAGEQDGKDPHVWMDPLTVKQFISPLATQLSAVGVDVAAEVARVEADLDEVNAEAAALLDTVPVERRRLVSGHESLGYFADRYGYTLVGAVIPSFSTQAEASAGALAELVAVVKKAQVPAVFTELGTPAATVQAIADDAGVEVVVLATHLLPTDGSYRRFIIDMAAAVAEALR
jgi:zinc/manganese transport system substrate-binding protein